MKTKHNELYESPVTEVVEVKQEGVICQSGLRDSYGNANDGIDSSELDGGIWNW
jgi:hypothetical protein